MLRSDNSVKDPADDLFGLAPFAMTISKALVDAPLESGFVVSLNGPWGCGKTTCLNFMASFLGSGDASSPIVVRFNPWWFSGRDDLLAVFFRELEATLGNTREVVKLLAHFARLISEEVEQPWVRVLLRLVLGRGSNANAAEAKKRLEVALARTKRPIIVMIDDVDRLEREEIRMLFRVVKAVADFPNVRYVLAFDRQVVAQALGEKDGSDGEPCLAKIVQLAFDLPPPPKHVLISVLHKELRVTVGIEPSTSSSLSSSHRIGVHHFLGTLRDVKRLVNALSVSYPSVRGEVHAGDFVAVEVLRLFSPNSYGVIRAHPHVFGATAVDSKQAETVLQEARAGLSNAEQTAVQGLLSTLFPWISSKCTDGMRARWRAENRICCPSCFDVYFRWVVPATEVSNAQIQDLMRNIKEFEANLLKIISNEEGSIDPARAASALHKLSDSQLPVPDAAKALLSIGDRLVRASEPSSGAVDIEVALLGALEALTGLGKRVPPFPRLTATIHDAVVNTTSVFTIVAFYKHVSSPGSGILTVDQTERLRKLVLRRVKERSLQPDFLETPRLGEVLLWWDSQEPGTAKDWVLKRTTDHRSLVRILEGFLVEQVSVEPDGQRITRADVDAKALSSFIDPSEIVEICRSLLRTQPGWLTVRGQYALRRIVTWREVAVTVDKQQTI